MTSYTSRQLDCVDLSESPGSRLASFRKGLGLSQRALGSLLGFSGGFVGQIEANIQPPSRNFLEAISDRYGVSSDWLLHGVGEQKLTSLPGFSGRSAKARIEPPDRTMPLHGDFQFNGEEFAMIRRMDLSVSAGRGLVPVDGGDSEALAFSRKWLRSQQIGADLAVLVRVRGDSMAPGIPDHALVLVNVAEKTVERSGIYAFNRGEESYIKRLVPSPENGAAVSLAIISNNPAYQPELLTGAKMNEVRIIGRVRCVIATV